MHWKAQMGPNTNRLSGAARSFIQMGGQWQKVKTLGAAISGRQGGPLASGSQPQSGANAGATGMPGQPAPELGPGKPTSIPNLASTRFSGAVQSETSTAWCGRQAVTGFNDSGSFWEAGGIFGSGARSFDGYAVSGNAGGTFTDKDYPTLGPSGTFMAGDPVLACSSPTNFIYASLYFDGSVPGPSGKGLSAISISISTDGGNTFSSPIAAIEKDANYHFLDKPWMTIDPSNSQHIYVTYTDFDNETADGGTGNSCGLAGSNISRTAIELVDSADGGTTWSVPTVVTQVCGNPFVQGSQVAVAPATGKVYVAWETFAADFFTREIDIASSVDGGTTFSTPATVSSVKAVGDGDFAFGIQGFIRDFEFPSLAIGKGKNNAGSLYITWNDGDNRIADQFLAFVLSNDGIGDGKYGFSDVMFTSSIDGGTTWTTPAKVNQTSLKPVDHYQPGVATDKVGRIAVCWYDRRRDVNNFLIDRFCGSSTDGVKWTNAKITPKNYPSVVNQDLLIASDYQGDYDQLTSDATNAKAGFLGGFVNTQLGNQNVLVNRF